MSEDKPSSTSWGCEVGLGMGQSQEGVRSVWHFRSGGFNDDSTNEGMELHLERGKDLRAVKPLESSAHAQDSTPS